MPRAVASFAGGLRASAAGLTTALPQALARTAAARSSPLVSRLSAEGVTARTAPSADQVALLAVVVDDEDL
jgi:hypothetical protein